MIKLNVGNKWSFSYLYKLIKLNKEYKKKDIQILSLYGDILIPNTNIFLRGVRPPDRLPTKTLEEVQEYVKICQEEGLKIFYTLNAPCISSFYKGQEKYLKLFEEALKNLIDLYLSIGIKNFIVTSPYLMEKIFKPFGDSLSLELSTIHNNLNFNFIEGYIKEFPQIKKVCLPIYFNRDFVMLKKFYKSFPDITFELIANEFCTSFGNICLYRNECYLLQSHNLKLSLGKDLPYPFGLCSKRREEDKSLWLKAPFILPYWTEIYNQQTNINTFKITGRTIKEENVLEVVENYMKMFECPDIYLHELWGGSLKGIKQDNLSNIRIRSIPYTFIDHFVQAKNSCNSKSCEECGFCQNTYMKNREDKNVV